MHARGSAAHGYFECYEPLTKITRASLFSEAGKRTPVFVRFSTVAGERGSTDTARDVRGFAVKFYTDEGNWDLVGNNIPVFFIQDAMKFPDLIHAVKPEPHHAMPQAASAHDTFWDFVSLMPESVHMQMWVMSDRAIPRSYRMMQGFGVHTFRMVNERGAQRVREVPLESGGRHAFARLGRGGEDLRRRSGLPSPRSVGSHRGRRLSRMGAGPADLHRGAGREVQLRRARCRPRSCPRSWCRCSPVGRMVLNRNPDNFFAETEQVAFCAAHIVPGPRLHQRSAARRAAFIPTWTRRSRGSAGLTSTRFRSTRRSRRCTTTSATACTGRPSIAAAWPTSRTRSAAAVRSRPARQGFTSFPQPVEEDKVRGKPEKFADHYTQAALFYNSQTPVEQAHIIRAFRFELTKVQVPAIRERVVSQLVNVERGPRACRWPKASASTCPKPQPAVRAAQLAARSESARPRCRCWRGRATAASARAASRCWWPTASMAHRCARLHAALSAEGAVPRYVGPKLGTVETADGGSIDVEVSLETAPSVLFDAVVLPDGDAAVDALGSGGPGARIHQGSVPALQDHPGAGRRRATAGEGGHPAANLPNGGDDPGILLSDDAHACCGTLHRRNRQAPASRALHGSAAGMKARACASRSRDHSRRDSPRSGCP